MQGGTGGVGALKRLGGAGGRLPINGGFGRVMSAGTDGK